MTVDGLGLLPEWPGGSGFESPAGRASVHINVMRYADSGWEYVILGETLEAAIRLNLTYFPWYVTDLERVNI